MKLFLGAVALAAVAAAPEAADAAPGSGGKPVEQASQVLRLNREAMEMFEALEFDLARRSLLEAMEVGQTAGLGDHAVMARTHANLALVYGVGLKDEARAIYHFKKALRMRPDYRLPRELATAEASRLFARAQRELKEGGAAAAPLPAAPAAAEAAEAGKGLRDDQIRALLDAPAPAAGAAAIAAEETDEAAGERSKGSSLGGALKCPTAAEVHAGDDITFRCVTASGLRATSVILYYKRPGREEFSAVPMKVAAAGAAGDGRRATWIARLPGDEVSGKWLPFYFEARDGRGESVALNGRDDSPNIITIRGGAGRTGGEAGDGEENPLVEQERSRRGPGGRRLWLGLGLGSGGGYAAGKGLEAYRQYVHGFTPGFAPAGLAHAVPEIGYFVSPGFAVSLQGRHQYIPRENRYTSAGANAVLARLLFFTAPAASRFYGGFALGGGEGFRLQVQANTTDGKVVKDTVRGGPLVAGAGGGFAYAFGETWSWILESNLLAGFPDFSAVLDVNTGLRAGF